MQRFRISIIRSKSNEKCRRAVKVTGYTDFLQWNLKKNVSELHAYHKNVEIRFGEELSKVSFSLIFTNKNSFVA